MIFRCAGTGSTGNSYALYSDSGQILLLESGVQYKKIIQMVDWDITNVVGCIQTHDHKDHSKSEYELTFAGIPVWTPYRDLENVQFGKKVFGDFTINSFPVEHDGEPCVGYMITVDGKKILYVTDAEYIRYSFQKHKLNTLIIECNYQTEYASLDDAKTRHVLQGHMSLDTCIGAIQTNQTENLENVILVHMSTWNCNAKECVQKVKEITSSNVRIAYKMCEYII